MFALDSFLPYLLNQAGSRIADAFAKELRPYGISPAMWRALAALYHADGQRIGQLARMTGIEVSTLSRLVGSMQQKGLVRRRRPEDAAPGADARTVTAHLTPAGRTVAEQLIPRAMTYERVALVGFGPEETALLKQMLNRLYDNVAPLEAGAAARGRRATSPPPSGPRAAEGS